MSGVKKSAVALIACGCFNPPTLMHLRLFETARFALEQQGFSVPVGLISAAHDKYGKETLIGAEHRVEMCERACRTSTWIRSEDWETRQSGWSKTSDVLDEYHAQLQLKFPGISCKLICGSDLLQSFNTPNLWSDEHVINILDKHGVVCIKRKDFDVSHLMDNHPILSTRKSGVILVDSDVTNDVSSSLVRGLVQKGSSIKYLVPDEVIEYIQSNSLYLTPT